MTIALLVFRSLRQHAVATAATALSLALAAGLLMTVQVVQAEAARAFQRAPGGFDGVLGARGSKLQLVLSALFHLEPSPGNVGAADHEAIRTHPAVSRAVPVAYGDNYRGWRIVGTTPDFFAATDDAPAPALRPGGRWFAPGEREAVVGALAARQLGWRPGDTFRPYHGLAFDPDAQHEEVYTVVGLLEPTGTPVDRAIWIPLEGVQTMEGHDPRAAEEVSAVLVKLRSPAAGFALDRLYNRQGNRLTFAWPVGAIVADLFAKLGWFDRVLALVAALVAVAAAGGVLAGIHATMEARRRDLAILRALGAHRRTVFGVVLAEAAAIGALGAVLGWLVHAALAVGSAAVIRAQTGVALDLVQWHPALGWVPVAMVALAALAGLAPAIAAYRTPVADTLAPPS